MKSNVKAIIIMSHTYISRNSRWGYIFHCNMHIFSVLIFLAASAVIRSAPSAHHDSETKGFGTAKHVLVIGCDGFGMFEVLNRAVFCVYNTVYTSVELCRYCH